MLAASGCATQPQTAFKSQVAFLNHIYAVLDSQTAEAIDDSSFLRQFADFAIRTTQAAGGDSYTGHYLYGQHTYVELFGPRDGGGSLGSTGVALSSDRQGGLVTLNSRLSELGVTGVESGEVSRTIGSDQIPWYTMVHPHDEPDALAVWGVEYLPSFMDDPRSGKRTIRGQDDVISRARYLGDGYEHGLMRDICAVEIAATEHDVSVAQPMFIAAGFTVDRNSRRLIAHDGQTRVTIEVVPKQSVSLRRIDFVLNHSEPRHLERIGHSTLTVGPGAHANWVFDGTSAAP